MTTLQQKLLKEIQITDNKDYDNKPTGRLRHRSGWADTEAAIPRARRLLRGLSADVDDSLGKSRSGRVSAGQNGQLLIKQDREVSETPILTPVLLQASPVLALTPEITDAKSFPPDGVLAGKAPKASHKRPKLAPHKPNGVRKLGRPRLYLAEVIERGDGVFTVKIKFNIRNKMAKRLLGVRPPVPLSVQRLKAPRASVAAAAVAAKPHRPQRSARAVSMPALSSYELFEDSVDPVQRSLSQKARNQRQRHPRQLDTREVAFDTHFVTPEPPSHSLPYLGTLPYPQCIINNTDPTSADRALFARLQAEGEKRRRDTQTAVCKAEPAQNSGADAANASAEPQSMPLAVLQYYQRAQIEKIQLRDYLIDTWYSLPYPEEYARSKVLYICEYCLKYMSLSTSFERHRLKNCNMGHPHPPGVEIYRDPEARIAFWEVDGRKNTEYCQNLCLLAKLFLNSKTLYYDVEPFVFYVLTELDEDSLKYHFVGYFLKEKLNNSDYNVLCILTLPIYQRRGYGNLMIDFSYLLLRREFKFGTPEKPLSDLGLASYRSYWRLAVALTLKKLALGDSVPRLSLDVLSRLTGMKPSDVVFGLEQLDGFLRKPDADEYAILINLPLINETISKWESRGHVRLRPNLLVWKPIIYGPSGGINLAPRLALQNGSVSNSISMITQFLQDDIDHPHTFEEEAYRDMAILAQNPGEPAAEKDYIVCRPHQSTVQSRAPTVDTIRLADSGEDDPEEPDDFDYMELGSEQPSEAGQESEGEGQESEEEGQESEEEDDGQSESDQESDDGHDEVEDEGNDEVDEESGDAGPDSDIDANQESDAQGSDDQGSDAQGSDQGSDAQESDAPESDAQESEADHGSGSELESQLSDVDMDDANESS